MDQRGRPTVQFSGVSKLNLPTGHPEQAAIAHPPLHLAIDHLHNALSNAVASAPPRLGGVESFGGSRRCGIIPMMKHGAMCSLHLVAITSHGRCRSRL